MLESSAAALTGFWHKRQYMSITGTRRRDDAARRAHVDGPTVRMTRDGMIHLFVRGVDKSIWYKSQALVNETLQFEREAAGRNIAPFVPRRTLPDPSVPLQHV